MVKRIAVGLFCAVFAVFGYLKCAVAAEWPPAIVKECEQLKADAHEKKDMPPAISGVKEIKGDELKKWVDEGKKLVIMDNRGKADYDKEHIKDAVLFPVDDLIKDQNLASRFQKTDVLVAYCNGVKCWRSPATMKLLQSLGYTNLFWYRDGLPDWIKKDFPTIEGGK